jgi:hypothetical protein
LIFVIIFFFKDHIAKGDVSLDEARIDDQLVDIFTKSLYTIRFCMLRNKSNTFDLIILHCITFMFKLNFTYRLTFKLKLIYTTIQLNTRGLRSILEYPNKAGEYPNEV